MNKSFFIVDDSEVERYIIRRRLKKAFPDYAISETECGKEALDTLCNYKEKLESHEGVFPPAVIFLDINMPLINGFQFLRDFVKLREDHPELKSCIVMIFTSSNQKEDMTQAFSYPFVKDFIVKGENNTEEIKQKVLIAMNRASSQGTISAEAQ